MKETLKTSGYSWYFSLNTENLDPMGAIADFRSGLKLSAVSMG
jgi:hypothetical protein